jgi:hypothetical protein
MHDHFFQAEGSADAIEYRPSNSYDAGRMRTTPTCASSPVKS